MRFHVAFETTLPPEGVMAALTDFTENRPKIWKALSADIFKVHELGEGWAEVTEGSRSPKVWARERYDWEGGTISWKALESNFCLPGSGIDARVTPSGAGSRVEVNWMRKPSNLKGRLIIGMMGIVGKRLTRSYLKKTFDGLAASS